MAGRWVAVRRSRRHRRRFTDLTDHAVLARCRVCVRTFIRSTDPLVACAPEIWTAHLQLAEAWQYRPQIQANVDGPHRCNADYYLVYWHPMVGYCQSGLRTDLFSDIHPYPAFTTRRAARAG